MLFRTDQQHDILSNDQIEYKREQARLDELLQTMKHIVQLDEKLSNARQNNPDEPSISDELQENLIQELIRISTRLDNKNIQNQVDRLKNERKGDALLRDLRSIVLTGFIDI